MARKKNNGFGFKSADSFALKNFASCVKSMKPAAAGRYPADRRYGSSITRSVIEQYDLDSDWVRWRKGLEYYYQAAWLDYTDFNSKINQGTDFEYDINFKGWRFATQNADTRNHYVVKRTNIGPPQIGTDLQLRRKESDRLLHQPYGEIWGDLNVETSELITRAVGARITDGVTTATVANVLTDIGHPAIFRGKTTAEKPALITVTLPLDQVLASPTVDEKGLGALVGEVGYVDNFRITRELEKSDGFIDGRDTFTVVVDDIREGLSFQILDSDTPNLPPSLLDLGNFDPIVTTEDAKVELDGEFVFIKQHYQRFYGRQLLSAELVQNEVSRLSYNVMPFRIRGYEAREASNELILVSEPVDAELQLYAYSDSDVYTLIFRENSFTNEDLDSYDGVYYHQVGPGYGEWRRLDTEIDPYQDEVFVGQLPLVPATLYTCSCPDFLHAKIRSPETTDALGNQANRQARYPMPTVMSRDSFQGQGSARIAGIQQSWATYDYNMSFRMCKHTVAAMFIDKLKVREPNAYPTVEARERFEEKLAKDISEVDDEVVMQLERSEITTAEIIYVLGAALNLDDTEMSHVLEAAKF